MNPKDALVTALNCGEPDTVPVALMGGGTWGASHFNTTLKHILSDEETMTGFLLKMAAEARSGIVYAGSGFPNLPAVALGTGIMFPEKGAVDLDHTIVSSEDELEQLDISRVDTDPYINTVRAAFRAAKAKIGDEYLVTMTAWGPFTLGARIVGEEAFVKMIYKKPEFLEKVLDFINELLIRIFTPLVEDGAIEMITIGDPTASGDLISKKQFETFALPHLRKFFDWTNSHDVLTILHICGDTTDRLELYPETGASCISLDHKTDIGKARETLAGKICFAGNIDPVHSLLHGSVEKVERDCLHILERAADGGGFILMPGCDIPPDVPLANIHTMIDTANNWKN